MKIVHLCLCSFFPDNYSYQENMLPKFHKELGYEVEVIASTQSFDEHGKVCFLDKIGTYKNEYDIQVTRLPYKRNNSMEHKLKRYIGTYAALEKAAPDILFIHGGQFMDATQVIKYLKKHPSVKVYVDNHADFSNSGTNWVSKNVLHKILWKHYIQRLNPYVTKFYGVLPARVEFLKKNYGLPPEKCELLVMGADDKIVEKATRLDIRMATRQRYGIKDSDFLVVTGGKINHYRPETLNLMEAISESNFERLKLIVFGAVEESLRPQFDRLCTSERIQFCGWKNTEDTYCLMAAGELVVFPGLHSVMWEQAVALGVPCVFRDIPGFHHVDLKGNTIFLADVSKEALKYTVESLVGDHVKYQAMREVAQGKGIDQFSYKKIAQRSIELK